MPFPGAALKPVSRRWIPCWTPTAARSACGRCCPIPWVKQHGPRVAPVVQVAQAGRVRPVAPAHDPAPRHLVEQPWQLADDPVVARACPLARPLLVPVPVHQPGRELRVERAGRPACLVKTLTVARLKTSLLWPQGLRVEPLIPPWAQAQVLAVRAPHGRPVAQVLARLGVATPCRCAPACLPVSIRCSPSTKAL